MIIVFSVFVIADTNQGESSGILKNILNFVTDMFSTAKENTTVSDFTAQKITSEEPIIHISNGTIIKFAEIINNKSINTPEIKEYFRIYNNFSNVEFKRFVKAKEQVTAKLGSFVQDNIKGININKDGYIIHVIYCNKYKKYCTLKINGVNTGELYSSEIDDKTKQTIFSLDNIYNIKIKSITFDYCDGRRFCDYHFDAYDIIELEIERGGRNYE